jgi:hypothetical protein
MVRRRLKSYLMYAVLAFQLALGMNMPMAHTAGLPQQTQPAGMQMAHCPEHGARQQAKHECCRATGCQCHCAFTLAVTGPTGLCMVVPVGDPLPALDPTVTTARPDDFFRPPIA